MDPNPYNITIPSQAANVLYAPSRSAADANSGWIIQYPQGVNATTFGYSQGIGTDFHQTTRDGATLQISWVGTAVYLFGQANSASYTIDVDGSSFTASSATVVQGGLLGSKTDLLYGNHTVTLTTHGANLVAFQYAALTAGVGYQGSTVQNQTILAVQPDNATPNSFFSYQGISGPNSWRVENLSPTMILPNNTLIASPRQMTTNTAGEAVTFTLSNTTAFFLRGALNSDHGAKIATITPISNPSQARTVAINDVSPYLEFGQILYWECGLDRNQNYTVQITDAGGTGANSFSISSLDIIDGGVPPPAGPGGTTGNDSGGNNSGGQGTSPAGGGQDPNLTSVSSKLSTGAIAGIAVAGAVLLLLGLLGLLFFLRRRRNRSQFRPAHAHDKTPVLPDENSRDSLLGTGSMQLTPHFATQASFGASASAVSLHANGRELDAGPVTPTNLPPQYESRWAPPHEGPSSTAAGSTISPSDPSSPSTTSGGMSARDEKRRQLVVLTYDEPAGRA